MAILNLPESLSKFTLGCKSITTEAVDLYSLVGELFNRFPQLLVAIQEEAVAIAIILNGEILTDAKPYILTDSCIVELLDIPKGEYQVAVEWGTKALVSATFNYIAAETAAIIVKTVLNVAIAIAANYAIGWAIDFLTTESTGPANTMTNFLDSPSYAWNGVQNTTATGTALGIVYGTHRVGGHIINVDTSTTPNTETTSLNKVLTILRIQLGLCEGEITAITNVQINNQAASYYAAVDTAPNPDYYRLGSANQQVMPDFNQVANTYSVSRKVF